MKKLVLIDGSSILYRAFFALPHFVTKNGEPTGALYGFLRMLLHVLKEEKPDYLIIAFDKKAPTIRHEIFADYKAQRPKMPDELSAQFETIHEILSAFKIPVLEKEGYEADDVIATVAKKAEEKGIETVVISGDMDLTQLIKDKIRVKLTRKGVTKLEEYTREKLKKDLGIYPEQIPDYKALRGDPSDNIKGVRGIGPKTAAKLLEKYGTVEELVKKEKSGKISENKDLILENKKLCTLYYDAPVEIDFEEAKFGDFDKKKVKSILERFEFKSLIRELGLNENSVSEAKTDDRIAVIVRSEKGKILEFAIANREKSEQFAIGEELFLNTEALDTLKRILANENKKEVFDLKTLHKISRLYGMPMKNIDLDVSLAGYLINPDMKNFKVETMADEFGLNCKTESLKEKANCILKISYAENEKLSEENLFPLYEEIEKPLAEVLADMELTGIKINVPYFKKLKEEIEEELEKLESKIFDLAGISFNILSSRQLASILFEGLGLTPTKRGKTGFSTSSAVLSELADEHPIVPLVLQYRHLAKLKSSYIESLPKLVSKDDSKLHTTFHQLGTITGRLRSSNPNLQNIPARTEWGEKIRAGFVATDENYVLISSDYSQIELRVLAHLSGDKNLIDAFLNNIDIHTRTAALVFGVKEEDVTKEMRRSAKILNFGIIYGMSPYGAAKQLGCSPEEAKAYIDSYFSQFPTVRDFIESLVEQARKTGETRTLLGRRRRITGFDSNNQRKREEARRVAINTPIQGSAADIIKIAMVKLYEKIKGTDTHLILQIHDELVVETVKDKLEEMLKTVKTEMENAYKLIVPLKVNIAYGQNLKEAKA
ncbi:MAG: DNA polymerase I [Caldisericaceae bacterium]|nr:DNA polymerase I [Caldisericaceae bacterium]